MGDKPTCGGCRWYEPGCDGDLPGRCRGGGEPIRAWPAVGACKAAIALMEAERERDEARGELLRARDGIDEACTQNRELARQLETLLEGSKP